MTSDVCSEGESAAGVRPSPVHAEAFLRAPDPSDPTRRSTGRVGASRRRREECEPFAQDSDTTPRRVVSSGDDARCQSTISRIRQPQWTHAARGRCHCWRQGMMARPLDTAPAARTWCVVYYAVRSDVRLFVCRDASRFALGVQDRRAVPELAETTVRRTSESHRNRRVIFRAGRDTRVRRPGQVTGPFRGTRVVGWNPELHVLAITATTAE
jgi:hypothetical protein